MPLTKPRTSPIQTPDDPRRWLRRLVRQHGTGLRRYLSTFSSNPEDLDDWTQEAFLRVIAALRSRSIDNPAAYLFTTARNVALSRFARRHTRDQARPQLQAMQAQALDSDPVRRAAQDRESREALLSAIAGMPNRCRQVFILCRLEGHSQKEVAEKLDIAVSTVEKHLARGLRHCRQTLCQEQQQAPETGLKRRSGNGH